MLEDYFEDLKHTTLKGHKVRSFGELKIANLLFRLGIDYEYEAEMEFNLKVIHPDFTVKYGGKTFIWEYIGSGMMQQPGYTSSIKYKLDLYRQLSALTHSIIVSNSDDNPEIIIKNIIQAPNPLYEYNSEDALINEADIEFQSLHCVNSSLNQHRFSMLHGRRSPDSVYKQYLQEFGVRENNNLKFLVIEIGSPRLYRLKDSNKDGIFITEIVQLDLSNSKVVTKYENKRQGTARNTIRLVIAEAHVISIDGKIKFIDNLLTKEIPSIELASNNYERVYKNSTSINKSVTSPALVKFINENTSKNIHSIFENIKEIIAYNKKVNPQLHLLVELTENISYYEQRRASILGREARAEIKVKCLHKFDIVRPDSPHYIHQAKRSLEEIVKYREAIEAEKQALKLNKLKELAEKRAKISIDPVQQETQEAEIDLGLLGMIKTVSVELNNITDETNDANNLTDNTFTNSPTTEQTKPLTRRQILKQRKRKESQEKRRRANLEALGIIFPDKSQ